MRYGTEYAVADVTIPYHPCPSPCPLPPRFPLHIPRQPHSTPSPLHSNPTAHPMFRWAWAHNPSTPRPASLAILIKFGHGLGWYSLPRPTPHLQVLLVPPVQAQRHGAQPQRVLEQARHHPEPLGVAVLGQDASLDQLDLGGGSALGSGSGECGGGAEAVPRM